MATPEIDIATHIANQLGALTLGTNCFHSPVRPANEAELIPAKAVFSYVTGGTTPYDYCGEDRAERRSRVQVIVRGDRDDYAGTLSLARSIRDVVHRSDTTLTDYVQVRVMEEDPIPIGVDDQGLPMYSINAELLFSE